jgi:NADH-quinone oxidoreductase subunit F
MEIIEKVKESSVANSDLAALEDVIFAMTETSICGLGMTAGTAIGSALKAWPGLFSDDDSISGEEEKPT